MSLQYLVAAAAAIVVDDTYVEDDECCGRRRRLRCRDRKLRNNIDENDSGTVLSDVVVVVVKVDFLVPCRAVVAVTVGLVCEFLCVTIAYSTQEGTSIVTKQITNCCCCKNVEIDRKSVV